MKIAQSLGEFLTPDDTKTGDMIVVLDEGIEKLGNYTYAGKQVTDDTPKNEIKKEYIFKVKHGTEDKVMRFNKYSRDNMIEKFGDDTVEWVGAECSLVVEHVRSLKCDMIIATPTGERSNNVKSNAKSNI
jgi:hypothetical protein